MEAKHKEVRATAQRVNDREAAHCDLGRQVGHPAARYYTCIEQITSYYPKREMDMYVYVCVIRASDMHSMCEYDR